MRERIARPLELPPAQRPSAATLGALAVAAGAVAVALGVLALLLGFGGDGEAARDAGTDARRAIGLLSKPSTQRIPFEGSGGAAVLAVGSGGRGALVLKGLEPAPTGWAYRAWVIRGAGGSPVEAASFSGAEEVVLLSRQVPPKATVAVSLESAEAWARRCSGSGSAPGATRSPRTGASARHVASMRATSARSFPSSFAR